MPQQQSLDQRDHKQQVSCHGPVSRPKLKRKWQDARTMTIVWKSSLFCVLGYCSVAASATTTCSFTHAPTRIPRIAREHYDTVLNMRGGAWWSKERSHANSDNATVSDAIDDVNLTSTVTSSNSNNNSSSRSSTSTANPSSLVSLFQFHNQIKAQASLHEAKTPRVYKHPPASNRGGAMVVAAKPKTVSKFRRRVPSWLAPLESSIVSSWTAQWMALDAAAAAVAPLDDTGDDGTADITIDESKLLEQSVSRRTDGPNHESKPSRDAMMKQSKGNEKYTTNVKQERKNSSAKSVQVKDEEESESDEDEDEDEDEDDSETVDDAQEELVASDLSKLSNQTASLYSSNFSLPEIVFDRENVSLFASSGYWGTIDRVLTFGLSETHPKLRASRKLRKLRKLSARVTGMHGLLSGKPEANLTEGIDSVIGDDDDAHMGAIRRRIAAIARARENLARFAGSEILENIKVKRPVSPTVDGYEFVLRQNPEEERLERLRKLRLKEIDQLIVKNQKQLQDLACEKDVLQRRPNPLWNYTADEAVINKILEEELSGEDSTNTTELTLVTTREFSFPPPDLVDEYLDMLFSSGRIVKLNHTDLWRNSDSYFDDEDDDDELSSPLDDDFARQRSRPTTGGSGSWMLRNGLGEKIGEAVETAGYKAVCQSIMSVLARGLAAVHGVSIMKYSDVALSMESIPDLPPLAAGIIPSSGKSANYAQGAIERAMKRGARKRRQQRRDGDFIQRDAVVETLLSHCQISAPLLTLFPIVWQRALLGNIITLVAAVISDFFEGVELQILGHRLSFLFKPITESDMLRSLGTTSDSFSRRSGASQERFEAAVQATAEELAENLKFLDRWHERALGSGLLRQQIANLIARVVLTLADDVLSSARMDLWTAQAGGPRLIAGLEYRP